MYKYIGYLWYKIVQNAHIERLYNMARSEAQKRADKKYSAEKYQQLQARVTKAEYAAIDEFCKLHDISKARFIFWACNYFIERGELPPESEVKQIEDDPNNIGTGDE